MEHLTLKTYWFLHEEVILWYDMSKLVIFMKKSLLPSHQYSAFSKLPVEDKDGSNRNFRIRKKINNVQLLTM